MACGSAVQTTASSSGQRFKQRKTWGQCPAALPPSQCTRIGHSLCYLEPPVLSSCWSPVMEPLRPPCVRECSRSPRFPQFCFGGFPRGSCSSLLEKRYLRQQRWFFLSALAHSHQSFRDPGAGWLGTGVLLPSLITSCDSCVSPGKEGQQSRCRF